MNNDLTDTLNIKMVCQETGITEFVLRAWEKRYQVVQPARLPNGHRVYTRYEVQKLKQIKHLVDQGRSISKVARLPLEELGRLVPAPKTINLNLLPGGATENELAATSLPQHVEAALRALRRFDLDRVSAHLLWGRDHAHAKDFCLSMVIPLLWRIGEAVANKELSISHEHAFSMMLKGHLAELLRSVQPDDRKVNLVMAGPEGDQHDFCLTICAILAAARGYNVVNLGADLPTANLIQTANELDVDIVMFGTSHVPREKLREPLEISISALATQLHPTCDLWVGGPQAPLVENARARTSRSIRQITTLEHFDACMELRVSMKHGNHLQQLS